MKAAVYVRVSTGKQEIENQLIQLRAYCGKANWSVYQVYADVVSGKEDKRPGFDEMFKDAHKLLFDIVLFWDFSRFSRSGLNFTLRKLTELENLGVSWHSFQEPYVNTDNDLTKNVVLAVLASVAKAEREKISERTKAGLDRARAMGKKLGAHCRKHNYSKIWAEYEKQERSTNRTAKLCKESYGTIQFIISNDIHDQKTYERLKEEKRLERQKKLSLKDGGEK